MSEPLNILIVDDQPGVRYLLDIVIREVGHRVYTARNGLEAIEIAKSSHPDLIFMDVRMPLMGGLEALGEIKAMIPETEVIIMTAYGSEETVTRAMEGGALCCIAKPFDVEKIKGLLEKLEWKQGSYKENKETLFKGYA
ncbi:MAG: response regulator [Desulfotomaculaceae bacterium]|nr:response regulator [Desulfotomaculaceae bacterium]